MDFGQIIRALKEGKCVARNGWNKFIVKQIPCKLEGLIIEKLQNIPNDAKTILLKTEGTPVINYKNQLLIIDNKGNAENYIPSISDIFAEDWCIVNIK